MSILINKETKIIVQGIAGKSGKTFTKQSLKYGSSIVGGVINGEGGSSVEGVPIFNTVEKAVEKTDADTSIIFVPAHSATDAVIEGIDAGLKLIVCITNGISADNLEYIKNYLKNKNTRLVGPYCPGIITPEECKLGIIPEDITQKGHVGIVGHSGTLTYEATYQLTEIGIGQSTIVGIGGEEKKGSGFIDILKLFNEDIETKAVLLIGEVGDRQEEMAAEWIKENMKKPVLFLIVGQSIPPGVKIGYAPPTPSNSDASENKKKELEKHGVKVVDKPFRIGEEMISLLRKNGLLEKCLNDSHKGTHV